MQPGSDEEPNLQLLANRFGENFLWGTATAAYQIEGAINEDGRGESIWDRFSHTPGKILNGDTGDIACDHYHRWREDIALMQELGVKAYRFSIAWSRILPEGTGRVNEAGLAWYERLVDSLLEAGIQPWVTLYHWDLPQGLQERGGWASRETVDAFVAYVEIVARRLGNRVAGWITHNEPFVVTFHGHHQGKHAPGIADLKTALEVSHHLLLSHGRAVPLLRSITPTVPVGITLNLSKVYPASNAPEDIAAAQRHDGYLNRWFLDPVFGRGYPRDMLEAYGEFAPEVESNDLVEIAAPIDFLGVNSYFPSIIRDTKPEPGRELGTSQLTLAELNKLGYETTGTGWPVGPEAFRELILGLAKTYNPGAIYITENGAAFEDTLVDGAVNDPRRAAYLLSHIEALAQAVEAGAPVRGYFVWSFIDNFEWALGYSQRFGIIYVDYQSQERILKESGRFFQKLIQA